VRDVGTHPFVSSKLCQLFCLPSVLRPPALGRYLRAGQVWIAESTVAERESQRHSWSTKQWRSAAGGQFLGVEMMALAGYDVRGLESQTSSKLFNSMVRGRETTTRRT
jgi:hypothetical protein